MDARAESILVPIYGVLVPFHILTVKGATNNVEGSHARININFNFGAGFEPGIRFPDAIFIKELTYRSSDLRRAAKVRALVLCPLFPPLNGQHSSENQHQGKGSPLH